MSIEQNKPSGPPENDKQPSVNIGNASNPAPEEANTQPASNQLLGKDAEKYLREVASIEDSPDAADQQVMDDTIKREKEHK